MTLREFLFPRLTRRTAIRMTAVVLTSFVTFKYILIPVRIDGISMEPTYHDKTFNLCFRAKYRLHAPARYDVVLVKLAGFKITYLKRIVALPGETVEFKASKLFVNSSELPEPYIRMTCDWVLPERKVAADSVYVVGDNRGIPLDQAEFGETALSRIVGGPIW